MMYTNDDNCWVRNAVDFYDNTDLINGLDRMVEEIMHSVIPALIKGKDMIVMTPWDEDDDGEGHDKGDDEKVEIWFSLAEEYKEYFNDGDDRFVIKELIDMFFGDKDISALARDNDNRQLDIKIKDITFILEKLHEIKEFKELNNLNGAMK